MTSDKPTDIVSISNLGQMAETERSSATAVLEAPVQEAADSDWYRLEHSFGNLQPGPMPVQKPGRTKAVAAICAIIFASLILAAPLAVLAANIAARLDYQDRAIAVFNLVLAINKGYVPALSGRANAYRLQGRFSDALVDLNNLLTANPAADDARAMRVDILSFLHLDRQANSDLQVLRRRAPSLAISFQSRSYENIYSQGDHPQEIIRLASLALAIEPNLPKAHADRAWGYLRLGNYEYAAAEATNGLALNPDLNTTKAALYMVRAEACGAMAHFDKAVADARAAIYADPKAREYCSLTLFLIQAGKFPDALAAYKECRAKVDSKNCIMRFLRRQIYLTTNDPRLEFIPALTGFGKMKVTEYFLDRADLYLEGKNYNQALLCCLFASASTPGKANVLLARGRAYLGLERYEQARADLSRCLAIRPELAQAYYFRALAEASLGHIQSARADSNQAAYLGIKAQPDAFIHIIQDYLP